MRHLEYVKIIHDTTQVGTYDIIIGIATLVALGFSIYQSFLARRALDAAKIAIEEDKRSRQLSMIPKMSSVIEVQIRLDRWIKILEECKRGVEEALETGNESILKKISNDAPRDTQSIEFGVDKYVFDLMSESLQEIVLSGVQYFYNAASPSYHLWSEHGSDFRYAETILERYDESLNSLKKLKNLINDMIPSVLLETPASISNSLFITKNN